jgi:hypothetical protein
MEKMAGRRTRLKHIRSRVRHSSTLPLQMEARSEKVDIPEAHKL